MKKRRRRSHGRQKARNPTIQTSKPLKLKRPSTNQPLHCYCNFKTLLVLTMVISRFPLCRVSPLYSTAFFHLLSISPPPIASLPRPFRPLSSISTAVSAAQDASTPSYSKMTSQSRWKPMCLYYTQGKCTMVKFLNQISEPFFFFFLIFRPQLSYLFYFIIIFSGFLETIGIFFFFFLRICSV